MQRRHQLIASLNASVPRDRAFWAAVSVLLVGQLIAFWTLCTQQVQRAEERHATAQVQTRAVADCMHRVPNATLVACMRMVTPADQQNVAVAGAATNVPPEPPENSVYH